ncbi:MAG: hypothetical protein ABJE63_03280 [Lentilitoribacter sp.]
MTNVVIVMNNDMSTNRTSSFIQRIKIFIKEAYADAPALSALTIIMLLLMVPKLGAMLLDTRLHNGVNIWVKPVKFDVALVVYTATLVIFARWIPQQTRTKTWFKYFTAAVIISIVYEQIWIGGAAAFGTSSHFNVATPLMGIAYTIAGFGAVTLTSGALVFGILIARNKRTGLTDPLHFAIWLSSILMFVLTVITASYMSSQLSHFVGGNLLDTESHAIMGWAKDGGDLRVAHFFASHIFHVLPILVIAASHVFKTVSRNMVIAMAVLYSIFTFYTLWEATQGLPFLAGIIG